MDEQRPLKSLDEMSPKEQRDVFLQANLLTLARSPKLLEKLKKAPNDGRSTTVKLVHH